ncbi:hypothetical protein SAMN02745227_01182 [Anaerobranca californiensis DSM 14826]|jgi:hypothetical protein|uniref:Sporulation related domain-containing protein n=1 Tax=Anaerobranca californiensis DSM 14826 TaxID=1120989 RepID=A0A1M6NM73_9FIRM|nr:hypothetical protein [Anaerobranca californiensis]SHJ96829.1 hypothetical protein SAMN02745227_01182 [Anaerobranca californiensis DSM 14826]
MRRKRKRPLGKIFILAVVTILLTYVMGRYFEELVLKFSGNNNSEPVDTNNKFEVFREVTEVYIIQNGVFTVAEGAHNQFVKLKDAGFHPVMIEEGNYRLITGIYLDKDWAMSEVQLQKNLGFENYLVNITLPVFSLEVSTVNEKNKLETIFTSFNTLLENTQQYFINNLVVPIGDLELNYQGDKEEVLKMVELLELYKVWQTNPNDSEQKEYLQSLVKYLRSHK